MSRAIRVLIDSLIDYAGLFPPAALDMRTAVSNYVRYAGGPHAFALARFVVPAARLDEFSDALRVTGSDVRPQLSVLLGASVGDDVAAIARLNDGGLAVADAIEVKAETPGKIAEIASALPAGVMAYYELPLTAALPSLVHAVKQHGGRAKIRTGGITPEAFPDASAIAAFIALCAEQRVAFKATAGLHHPIRCMRPLTYEADAVRGMMHGFMNVFLAATLIREGAGEKRAAELIREEDPDAFAVSDDGITWRGAMIRTEAIASTRRDFAIAFGSCSFEEPVEDLQQLGWL